MERGSRFILEQKCGKKDEKLFETVMKKVCAIIENTGDVTSDGERRYGIFDLIYAHRYFKQILRTGKLGRPAKKLPKGVKVRVKNKGSQSHKHGTKRPKYQTPQPEHPDITLQDLIILQKKFQ